MIIKIIHLNIERSKHVREIIKLIQKEEPDVLCFEEAMYKDVKKIAFDFSYNLAFAPLLVLENQAEEKEAEGSAILSKFLISDVEKYKYNDQQTKDILVRREDQVISKKGVRPQDRFLYNYTLLNVSIKDNKGKTINIATTHFPVVDHQSPGLPSHKLNSLKDIDNLEHSDIYLENLISKLRKINNPLIFTADLNNARGEYVYDQLAHELIDIVPQSVTSTIDPNLHRRSDLKLVVDTIMISPDIKVKKFSVLDNISDHKALLAQLEF